VENIKYVLLDKSNEIVDTIDSVTPNGAEQYFMERKRIHNKKQSFGMWKIKTKKEHDLNQTAFKRKPSSESVEWWVDEKPYLDIDKV